MRHRGQVLLKLGRCDEAVADLDACLATDPLNPVVQSLRCGRTVASLSRLFPPSTSASSSSNQWAAQAPAPALLALLTTACEAAFLLSFFHQPDSGKRKLQVRAPSIMSVDPFDLQWQPRGQRRISRGCAGRKSDRIGDHEPVLGVPRAAQQRLALQRPSTTRSVQPVSGEQHPTIILICFVR